MSGPRLSTEQKDEIVRMYQAGQSVQAAEKFGTDPSYPRILARRRLTKKLSPRERRRLNAETR